MPKLSPPQIKALTHPGDRPRPVLFHDGEGLALQITKGGAKSWLFRFQLAGKAREMGLGPVAVDAKEAAAGGITLAMARERARSAKALLREGKDPIIAREAARTAAAQQAAEASERSFRAAAEARLR